jgi:hypothetical protein
MNGILGRSPMNHQNRGIKIDAIPRTGHLITIIFRMKTSPPASSRQK